jgi:hypothetical protein
MSIFDLFVSSKFNKKRSSRCRPPADPYAEYDEKGNYISPGRRARRIERAHREAMSDQDARNRFYGVRSTLEAFAHDQRQGPIPSNSEMQQSHGQPLFARRQPTRGGDPSLSSGSRGMSQQEQMGRASRRPLTDYDEPHGSHGLPYRMPFVDQNSVPNGSRGHFAPSPMHPSVPSNPHGGLSAHDFASPMPNHPAQQQPSYHPPQHHQSQPVRPGKLLMGAPLPPGIQDPFAKTSVKPQGIHGLREHVPGMTNMNFDKYGDADDPKAQWKLMQDFAKMQEENKRRGGEGRR